MSHDPSCIPVDAHGNGWWVMWHGYRYIYICMYIYTTYIYICYIYIYIYIYTAMSHDPSCIPMHRLDTGWRRLIGSPKLQIIFHKRASKYRSLLQKMTYKDKGSYESSPPCIRHWHSSFIPVTWPIVTCHYCHASVVCDMTPSYVPWRIHMCDMADWYMCVTWPIVTHHDCRAAMSQV